MEEWSLPTSDEVLSLRIGDRLAQPWRERRFTFAAYDAFLARLADDPRIAVVPLAELGNAPRDRAVVGLRHDVDVRLDAALEFARLEHARGLRSTYYVLHTASYYPDVAAFLELQRLGHEVGWHNDLVTLECVDGVDARGYLRDELARLRGAGLDVRGVAAHGSYWGHRLGYDNTYFFSDFAETPEGFPNRDVVNGRPVPKGTLSEFGFEYDANHLPYDAYFSDARFGADGRRWHPAELDVPSLREGERTVLLVHADHWDAGLPRKAARHYGWGALRMLQIARRGARHA